jgi:hypothetical protein
VELVPEARGLRDDRDQDGQQATQLTSITFN